MLNRVSIAEPENISENFYRHVTVFYTGMYRSLMFPRRLDELSRTGEVCSTLNWCLDFSITCVGTYGYLAFSIRLFIIVHIKTAFLWTRKELILRMSRGYYQDLFAQITGFGIRTELYIRYFLSSSLII